LNAASRVDEEAMLGDVCTPYAIGRWGSAPRGRGSKTLAFGKSNHHTREIVGN
jgi:hypothetical protein